MAAVTLEDNFIEKIQAHANIIHKVIRLYVDDAEDRKDLYQEIVGQAWKSFPSFRGEAKFSTWLYSISANTVLTFKRKVYQQQPLNDANRGQAYTSEEVANEQSEMLLAAIRKLPETDRLLVSLHLDEYTNEEIAGIIGIAKNNVAVKLHRIKQQLIKALSPTSVASDCN